ncbi:MAG TPA: M67 family metallopeptidase [Candidatus Limnocylindria bacterium]|nr:M67 family metallopeptidase [Candidatus Limnocylindria bacterium]
MRPGASVGSLEIPADLADRMLQHARAELPNEACGLVGGDPSTRRAVTFHPARNRHASPLRFDIHPEDLVRIVFTIESDGQELLAVFHSHPRSAAVPSPTDVREARYEVVHLIATLAHPRAEPAQALRGWLVADGSASEVVLRISA